LLIPHLGQELIKVAKLDKLPYPDHRVKVEVQVMDCIQDRREDLTRHEQMSKIGAGAPSTDRAGALLIDRALIFFVFGMLDHDVALVCE